MKRILFMLLLISNFCEAQNYQCLQSGAKHYFINGNGYLRGIRIDSVLSYADSTIYFPFHMPRGSYDTTGAHPATLDTNGGSWLGKRVKQLNDGTFIFDSYWNDSVVIKTQTSVGDSWIFYSDTSSLFYKAEIINADTMTVLNAVDSIKNILITARDSSGIVSSDLVDSFLITLSKNNGFVQVCDLYTFPYHKPDSVYRKGLDFLTDRSLYTSVYINWIGIVTNLPGTANSLFKLTSINIPNEQQLYHWNEGDVINSTNLEGFLMTGFYTLTALCDTVISKTDSGHYVNYTVVGTNFDCPYSNPCSLICHPGEFSFSDLVYPIIDTFTMPEEANVIEYYFFYFPRDSSYCSTSPLYILVWPSYISGLGGELKNINYKVGIGKTYYNFADGDPNHENDELQSCVGTLGINQIAANSKYLTDSIKIFPNPATDELNIASYSYINSWAISNLYGQIILSNECNSEKVTLDISSLPPGVYLVKINGTEVRKFVKQ